MKKRQKYSKEFKLDAVRLVTEQGYAIAEAARNLGLNANMLGRWKTEAAESEGAFRGNGKLSPEQFELRRLKAENRQLRMEREILKKATAFFAKESK
jgi:transposase